MHISTALIGLLVVSATAACSSGSKGSDPYCEHLADASQRLATAEQDLFTSGATDQGALPRIVTELQDVQKGAPADISKALAELVGAFQQAEQALQHPTKHGRQQLAQVANVLSVDGKKVSDYVTSKCK